MAALGRDRGKYRQSDVGRTPEKDSVGLLVPTGVPLIATHEADRLRAQVLEAAREMESGPYQTRLAIIDRYLAQHPDLTAVAKAGYLTTVGDPAQRAPFQF